MEMKKMLTVAIAGSLVFTCAACSKNENKDSLVDQDNLNSSIVDVDKVNGENENDNANALKPDDANVQNPEDSTTSNNDEKPAKTDKIDKIDKVDKADKNDKADKDNKTDKNDKVEKPVEGLPELKPVEPETPTDSQLPEETKKDEVKGDTLANVLKKEFESKAASTTNILELASELVQNPAILFAGDAVEVEEGFLTGFGNNQIKGFKSGAQFGPIIGSIPFVGYIFELNDASEVPTFIQTLESGANLRWNICVEAEEMVSGSVGNKVFFVMAPFSLED